MNPVDTNGWSFPADVPGWLDEPQARLLAELARGKKVLELGTYCGKSAISMAQTATSLVSVDWHRPTEKFPKGGTLERLQAELIRYGVQDRVTVLVGAVAEVLPWLAPRQFGLLFQDAGHSEQDVAGDLAGATRLLKPGGSWAIHDYTHGQYPGVRRAVDRFFQGGGSVELIHGMAIVR